MADQKNSEAYEFIEAISKKGLDLSYQILVTVTYHTVKTITPPMSAKEAKGTNYNEVVDSFRNAGFINVKTEPEYDIITGWLTKDGETESVSIGDDSKFNSSDNFRPDTTVVVKYHTLLKNKKK